MTSSPPEEETPQGMSIAMDFRRPSLTVVEALLDEQEFGSDDDDDLMDRHLPQHLLANQANNQAQKQQDNESDQVDKSFDTILHRLVPKPLPEYFVLGHSTMELGSVARLPFVLHRLCSFIQKASLDFSVIPEDGRVDCRAHSCLSFCIWIWQHNDHILVELQRRQGCGVLMQRYRKAFTRYLQSGTDFDTNALNVCQPMPPPVARQPLTQSTSQGLETLARCQSMLESDSDEQKQLALENLLLTLHSLSVSLETTQRVAHHILWEQTFRGDNRHTTLLDQLSFHFVCNQRRRPQHHPERLNDSCDFEGTEFEEGHTCGVMHNLALRTLASALEVATEMHPVSWGRLDVVNAPWRTILGALCYNVSNAATRPQEAALSARCLSLLDELTLDHSVVVAVLEHSSTQILPCLFSAQQYGTVHNAVLHREVRNLLERIQECIDNDNDDDGDHID